MTYDELVQRLQRWSRDTGTDFQTSADVMISDGELMISKDLNLDQMRVRSTLALVAGTYIYTKPTGCVDIRHISYVDATTGEIKFLEYRRREVIVDYAPTPNALADRAAPLYWDNYDTASAFKIYVGPTPIVDLTGEIEHEVRIAGLSSTTATTYLSLYQPDLLFNAALMKSTIWSKNPLQFQAIQGEYQRHLGLTVSEQLRVRSDATNLTRAN